MELYAIFLSCIDIKQENISAADCLFLSDLLQLIFFTIIAQSFIKNTLKNSCFSGILSIYSSLYITGLKSRKVCVVIGTCPDEKIT